MSQSDPQRRGGDAKRVAPNNIEAERCALGALLLDIYSASPALQLLSEEDFYLLPHRHIYKAITDVYDQMSTVDVMLVSDRLKKEKLLEKVGKEDYLLKLVEEVPSTANALFYAKLVRESALRRHLVERCTKIINDAYESAEDAREQLDRAEQSIFEVAEQKGEREFVPVPDLIDPLLDVLDGHKSSSGGFSTGFKDLDGKTSGLYPAELVVVAGRPSMGKTTFAMNIAQHAALELGKAVGMFSLEVSREQLARNLLSSVGKVRANELREGRLSKPSWKGVIYASNLLRDSRIFLDDSVSLNVLDVKAKARRLKARQGLDMLVVDYLQLMHNVGGDSRQEEISQISRGLKAVARELEIPVIAVSQLSRAVESREGHRPKLSDLRESGAIEQDADLVILLYREEYYKRDDDEAKGKAEAIIAKQRNGPTGTVKLAFRGDLLRFENLSLEPEPSF